MSDVTIAACAYRKFGPAGSGLAADRPVAPVENAVECHNCRHLRQDATSETHAENSQSTPSVVGEPQSPALQLRLQDSVLFSKVLDRLLFLASQPAEENRHGQL